MGVRTRKRSAAVTLVLAGSLAGCGEPVPQQDAYRSLADCQRDWGASQQCQPARDGRYASGYHYGPSYFGSSTTSGQPRPSPNAMASNFTPGARSVASGLGSSASRGGFGSTSSAHSSGS